MNGVIVEREKTVTVVTIPATDTEKRLSRMIDAVRAGRLGQRSYGVAYGRRCTLGLIDDVTMR